MTSSTPPPYRLSANHSLELVLHSPKTNDNPSPLRKSKTRLPEMPSDDAAVVRKRGKTKGGQKGLLASPRNPRRSRRREDNVEIEEIIPKPTKRKTNARSKKDKETPVPSSHLPSTPGHSDFNRVGEIISDLVMWTDVAKSSLWFGFGSLCFLSSCFAKGLNFSLFSMLSNLGLVFLCGSFLSNTLSQSKIKDTKTEFRVTEDDVLRLATRFLPAANFAIAKTTLLFSGEPSMTLKVTPFLLIGAEYGHLITLWRLSAFGFFLSFTIPKLYSTYNHQIRQKVDMVKTRIGEAWEVCSHKKILAGSAVTAFWNLTSTRTRIFAVFISLVILRYRRQNLQELNPEEAEPVESERQEDETLPQEQNERQEEETLPQEQEHTQAQEEQALVVVVAEPVGSKEL